MLNHTELTQAESHAPIVQAQSRTHLNKTLKRQRAIHMDRYTHAQSHTRVNTELTQAESHAPIVQAQSRTHLNKTLKRQRAIHMDRYTHAQSRTCVNTEPTQAELESHAPIVQAQSRTHLNKMLKRQRAIHVDRYTHAQSHRTHTSREPCTNTTSSIAHPLEQNAQEAESYTRGQVHTCSITQNSHKQRAMHQ